MGSQTFSTTVGSETFSPHIELKKSSKSKNCFSGTSFTLTFCTLTLSHFSFTQLSNTSDCTRFKITSSSHSTGTEFTNVTSSGDKRLKKKLKSAGESIDCC